MKSVDISFVLGVALTVSSAIMATTEGTLAGHYALAGATAIDPPPNEPRDTHLQLFITGGAARELYRVMPGTATPDECLGNGSMTKFHGGTACTMHQGGREYECALGIDIKEQRVVQAYAC